MSTPLHLRLRLQINQLFRVNFYPHAYGQELFDSDASHSFFVASCVKELGLKGRKLRRAVTCEFSLRNKGCELDIFGILLTVDLRVMDM